jgi:hypothetical protein
MDRLRTIHLVRRSAVALAGLAGALLAAGTAAQGASAYILPPSGGEGGTVPAPRPPVHVIVSGGMPGWQTTLIAVGAALAAAVIAVMLDRAWAARREATPDPA